MLSIVFIGIVTTLALFAIVARTCANKAKKAEKWEKGEIIKQLLALSEGENSRSAIAAPHGRSACSASTSAICTETLRKSTSRERNSKRRYTTGTSAEPNPTESQIHDKIRQRAYELYQERGGVNGNPTDDWLRAKQEVLSRKVRAVHESS